MNRALAFVIVPLTLLLVQFALPYGQTRVEDQRFTPLVGKWLDNPLPPVQGYAFTNVPGVPEVVKEVTKKIGKQEPAPAPIALELSDDIIDKACDGQARPASHPHGVFTLPLEDTRPVVINGSGSLHHVSYFATTRWIERLGVPYALVQIDAHDDSRDEIHRSIQREGRIDCGNWITWLVRKSSLLSHVFVFGKYFATGAGEHNFARWATRELAEGRFDLYPYPRRPEAPPRNREFYYSNGYDIVHSLVRGYRADIVGTLLGRGGRLILHHSVDEAIPLIGTRIQEKYVYISIDLDVLKKEFITTDWDNGPMTLDVLKSLIREIARTHTILGADICGMSAKAKTDETSVKTVAEVYRFLMETLKEQSE
ncbi:MAG: arginase family protein [Deltaproteobacteria bacterium]|nr:arginase family protein [Deltaproteobacteria bacterium]